MPTVQHRAADFKNLYNFGLLQGASDDPNRIVFLSERDFAIIWTATEAADKLRKRVFYDANDDIYNTVTDADFETFKIWISTFRNNIGGFQMSNEQLERIAIALEGINTKVGERVTWDDFISDLEDALGLTHWFVVLTKGIFDLLPQVRLKIDFTPLVLGAWEYFTWKGPVLALLGTMSAALTTSAAASVAEKGISVYRAALATVNTLVNVGGKWKDFFFGNWNVYDNYLKPLLDAYYPTPSGGTGGANPDNDPDLRTLTNLGIRLDNSLTNNISLSCGHGAGCSCGGNLGSPSTGSIVDSDPAPDEGNPVSDPPPDGFSTWDDYYLNKCAAANFIVDSTMAVFRVIGSANALVTGTITGATFGAVLVSVFNLALASFATATGYSAAAATIILGGAALATAPIWVQGAIVVAVAAVVVGAGIGVLSVFGALADEFEASRDELICLLFNSTTPTEANSHLSNAWADAIASFVIDPPYNSIEATIRTLMSTVISYLISNTLVNLLFQPSDIVAKYTGAGDCSACFGPCSTFDVDLQGWTKEADILGTGTLSWFTGGFAQVEIITTDGGDFEVNIISPVLSYIIQTGDFLTLCVQARAFTVGGTLVAIIDGNPVSFPSTLGGAETGLGHDLASYVGGNLTRIRYNLGWPSAVAGQKLNISQVGVDCPACDQS